MQNGFKDYLNHLNTKFNARRSDIIVSATMSFTLTPMADNFEPVQFYNINQDQIWDYVMKRQEYRATKVASNTLPKKLPKAIDIISDIESVSSHEDSQMYDASQDLSEFTNNQQSLRMSQKK